MKVVQQLMQQLISTMTVISSWVVACLQTQRGRPHCQWQELLLMLGQQCGHRLDTQMTVVLHRSRFAASQLLSH